LPADLISNLLQWLLRPDSGLVFCLALADSIHLVERRGKGERIDPKRQLDICTLLESIPEAALVIDQTGRIVESNSVAARLLGTTRERLRGADPHQFSSMVDQDSGQPIAARALQGEVVRNERRVLRNSQSGAVLDLLVSANPIRNEAGETMAALMIARDVTELRQLQQRIGDIERHRAIGQMAAALAHDFNNILETIGQAATLLEIKADRPASERKPLLGLIQSTVRRGAEIIARVREYIRTGTGALSPVDVRQVIEEAVELTSPLWQKAGIKLTTHLQPVGEVRTNAADLRRVFTNLIINAIEAMPHGGELTVATEQREGRVLATVSDTGVGIPPEHHKRIFFPYFTTKPGGTGLGLSGAQKILLSQGGNISVASEPGKGTTLTVMLPAMQAKTPPA
jgi:PAS domain S-box-containing protein